MVLAVGVKVLVAHALPQRQHDAPAHLHVGRPDRYRRHIILRRGQVAGQSPFGQQGDGIGIIPADRHGKAIVEILFGGGTAVLIHQLAFQIKIAHRFPAGAVVGLRRFRQHILPQRRHQRRRVTVGSGEPQGFKPGGIAQVDLPVGVLFRRPVVQRVYPALEFPGVLQPGQRRQQRILAVGAVFALEHPAVGVGVGNLHPADEAVAPVRRGLPGAVDEELMHVRYRPDGLLSPQRGGAFHIVIVEFAAAVFKLLGVASVGIVQRNLRVPAAVADAHPRHPVGGRHPALKAHAAGKDGPGIQHRHGGHNCSHHDASLSHSLKTAAEDELHEEVDRQPEYRRPYQIAGTAVHAGDGAEQHPEAEAPHKGGHEPEDPHRKAVTGAAFGALAGAAGIQPYGRPQHKDAQHKPQDHGAVHPFAVIGIAADHGERRGKGAEYRPFYFVSPAQQIGAAHDKMDKAQHRRRSQIHPGKEEGIKDAAHLRGRQIHHDDDSKGGDVPPQQIHDNGAGSKDRPGGGHAMAHRRQNGGKQGIGGHGQGDGDEIGKGVPQQQLPPGDRQAVVEIHRPAVVHIAHPGKRQSEAAHQPQQAHRPYGDAVIQTAAVRRFNDLQHPLALILPAAEHDQQVGQRNAQKTHNGKVDHGGDAFFELTPQKTAEAVRRGYCCNHNRPPPFLR